MILVLFILGTTGFVLLRTKKIKNNLIIFYLSLILLLILLNPGLCISCAHHGIILFYNSVFPSLFPFTVITSLILSFNGINIYSRLFGYLLCKPLKLPNCSSFPLIVSLICGFPLGAKYTGILEDDGYLTPTQATTTLIVASNASPLFTIGVIGVVFFKSLLIGYILFFVNVISCYICGILFSRGSKSPKSFNIPLERTKVNAGSAIRNSIDAAISTSLLVCAYITFFSVIIGYLNHYISSMIPLFNSLIGKFLLGLIELTNGVTLISNTDIAFTLKLMLISFLISFSGLSVFSQVFSLVYKNKLSFKKYFWAKTLQGFISGTIVFFLNFILVKIDYSLEVIKTLPTSAVHFSSNMYILIMLFLTISFIFAFIRSAKQLRTTT